VSKKVRHNAVAEWRNLGVTPSVAQALYQPPKAIRGGVPICWPQFSDFGSLSQHGFARNKQWDFVTAGADADGTGALVELSLCDTDETRAVWPHSFKLTMTVHLTGAGTLRCDLGVTNTGSVEMAFTAALHTYFRCDAQKSMVRGLHGCEYLDSLKGRQRFTQSDEAVSFDGEVDRIYLGASQSPLSLVDSSHSRTFSVAALNMPDTVVWNPHIAKAKAMADFDDDEWLEMVCIEPAVVQQPVILAPNASWKGSQLLKVDARCM
jgi:glucose-6-phosphate 1-epimerase